MQFPLRSNSALRDHTSGGMLEPDAIGWKYEIRPDLCSTWKDDCHEPVPTAPCRVIRANWSASVLYSDPVTPYVPETAIKRWPSKQSRSDESCCTGRFAPSWAYVRGQR